MAVYLFVIMKYTVFAHYEQLCWLMLKFYIISIDMLGMLFTMAANPALLLFESALESIGNWKLFIKMFLYKSACGFDSLAGNTIYGWMDLPFIILGQILHTDVVYLHSGQGFREAEKIRRLLLQYRYDKEKLK